MNTIKMIIDNNNISELNPETIDTSWMNKPQKRILKVLAEHYDAEKDYKYYLDLLGYKNNSAWYRAISDERFVKLISDLKYDIKQRVKRYDTHSEIQYIKSYEERKKYYENDTWDVRYLYIDYPRHHSASSFIIQFSNINNTYARNITKKYIKIMLNEWAPCTVIYNARLLISFMNSLVTTYENFNSFSVLTRDDIQTVIEALECSKDKKRRVLKTAKQMFNYMYLNKWDDAPEINLINKYDIPEEDATLPRPIPPEIKIALDNYIVQNIIPLLEEQKETPILEPRNWDALIILRHTGRRFEDLAHLIADDTDIGCLKYDKDN